jgi:hypothetical protein
VKILYFALLIFVAQAAFAQAPSGTPKPAFPGFGTALDQRPPSARRAQTPVPVSRLSLGTSSLTFSVRNVGSGGGADQYSDAGGKTRTRRSKTILELKVRNLSAQPATAQFQWFFLGQPSNPGARSSMATYVWDTGNRPVSVIPGGEITETLESAELVEATNTSPRTVRDGNGGNYIISTSQNDGARPVGWIVQMFADSKLVRVQASSGEFERIAYDANAMAALQANRPRVLTH